jgi:hypothetical protein
MRPALLTRPTEHIVAFYRSDDFIVGQVASFISEGLAGNEHVIAIATAVRLETLWNQLAQSHAFGLLCGYSMGHFYKDAAHQEICRLHTHVSSDPAAGSASSH